ncbi:MAG: hypothetical protein NC212_08960 [Staphylococcus sp.]|nr:hypothetical protein [Staphylococcus sp.]
MTYEEKIEAVINDPATHGLSPMAPVLAMYLKNFRPLDPPVHNEENRTSEDIMTSLESIGTFTINEIAATMAWLGYRLTTDQSESYNYGAWVWAMEYTGA